eukprot:5412566-Pleurochrysis_carterae.AAC.1
MLRVLSGVGQEGPPGRTGTRGGGAGEHETSRGGGAGGTPSGGGRAGRPQTARRSTAWTTTHAMSSHGIVLGRRLKSSAI